MTSGNPPDFLVSGRPSKRLGAFADELRRALEGRGYRHDAGAKSPRLVLNCITREAPRPYRKRATYVLSLLELPQAPADPIPALYPLLVKALSNMLLVYVPGKGAHFVTLEQGHYIEPEGDRFFERLFDRIHPMASSTLVIKNRFETDLEPDLWQGDPLTEALAGTGRKLEEWELLPAPFPIDRILSPKDLEQVKRVYGITGLSYGNLSARKDSRRFWMSASGVDKGRLREIGRDILMVAGYDEAENAMVVSVPPKILPRRVSVDAIEHWTIYREHPGVGAIVHVHAWMEGVEATHFNYPCGTYQLAQAVAAKVREAPDPARAVVGLKNHGLTVTGRSLDDIVGRIEGNLLKQIPMR